MGLDEKRLIKELQDTAIPGFESWTEELCGAKVKVDVDWKSFETDNEGLRGFNLYVLERMQTALESICQDDIGKDGVKSGLKKYQVKNISEPSKKKISFDKGVFKIEGSFGAGFGEGAFHDSEIRELIEGKL